MSGKKYARKEKSIKARVAVLLSDKIEFKATDTEVGKRIIYTGKRNNSSGVFNDDEHMLIYSCSKMYEMPTKF